MSRETSTITRKGQVTIPKRMRNCLGITEGDTLEFELLDNKIVARKLKRKSILQLGGVATGARGKKLR